MANDDDMSSCPHLFVGTWVTVRMKYSGDCYSGTVTFCDVEDNGFGLMDVEHARRGEHFRIMDGFYQFKRKDVELIAASQIPPVPSRFRGPYMPSVSSYRCVRPPSPTSAKALEDRNQPFRLETTRLNPLRFEPRILDPPSLVPPNLVQTSLVPPSLVQPSLVPPILVQPSCLVPPSLVPPSSIPPNLVPPSLDPRILDPPSLDPPSLDPPSLDTPSLDPPSLDPASE